ncbi:unnamed protein product [Gordionus sp. m RMFG-2023]
MEEEKRSGDNRTGTDEVEITWGGMAWPRDEQGVGGWDGEGSETLKNEEVEEWTQENNGGCSGKNNEAEGTNAEELEVLEAYLTPEFLDCLQCAVSD